MRDERRERGVGAAARGTRGRGGLPGGGGTLPASFHSATSPDGEACLAGFARAKRRPTTWGAGRACEA